MKPTREEIQRAYIRVCKDSRFQLDMIRAAHLAAAVLGRGQFGVGA